MTGPEMEQLWDEFETVEKCAAPIAYGNGYVAVLGREHLRRAIESYRRLRDSMAGYAEGVPGTTSASPEKP